MPVCRPPFGNETHSVHFGRRQAVSAPAPKAADAVTMLIAKRIARMPIRLRSSGRTRSSARPDLHDAACSPDFGRGCTEGVMPAFSGAALRPDGALIAGLHLADALVVELLHPLTFIGFGRVDVALRVDGDAVHAEELAGLAAAAAERGELRQRLTIDDAHTL